MPQSWWSRWFGGYRKACAQLQEKVQPEHWPKEPQKRLELLEKLLNLQKKRKKFLESEKVFSDAFQENWDIEQINLAVLEQVQQCVKTLKKLTVQPETVRLFVQQELQSWKWQAKSFQDALAQAQKTCGEILQFLQVDFPQWGAADWRTLPSDACIVRLDTMATEITRYEEWVKICTLRCPLHLAKSVCIGIENGSLSAQEASDAFERLVAEARWEECRRVCPEIEHVFKENRTELVKRFSELEKKARLNAIQKIKERYRERLPRGSMGEMEFVRSEMQKIRRISSIRTAMEKAGNMLLRIKPVFMMSPLSVARFLPPGKITFDILIIDEASQVCSEDALGAVARVRQLVVMGDDKQLPPTNFFKKHSFSEDIDVEENQESSDIADMESILSLCKARAMAEKTLRWHYRSRTPSLISVSKEWFYKELILPPSPWRKSSEMGLFLRRINGVYEKTSQGGGTNAIEAKSIVDAVIDHIRKQPQYSLGVVAFSDKQCERIQAELERVRRQDNDFHDFLVNHENGKRFFVKNLENVQGDERDVIFISVGYGPDTPGGKLSSQNFGPINKRGGERRLNVLFTRARVRCEVFVSFDPFDIDISKATHDGPKILRKFLEFAQSQQESSVFSAKDDCDRLVITVENFIRSLGYECEAINWEPLFQITLAVRHPKLSDYFMLAVVIDGNRYTHSSKQETQPQSRPLFSWVRERERLMLEVLQKMGWQVHRVWSTDWFNKNESTKKALQESLEKVVSSFPTVFVETHPFDGNTISQPTESNCQENGNAVFFESLCVPPYQKFESPELLQGEPDETDPDTLVNLVYKIICTEGPIHREIIAKRVAAAFGKSRTCDRIQETVKLSLKRARKTLNLVEENDYWMTPDQKQRTPVRRRTEEILKETAEFLPPCEIRAADALGLVQNGTMNDMERIRCILKMLGFSRMGKNIENSIRQALGLPLD